MQTPTVTTERASSTRPLRRGAELLLLGVIPVVALALALSAYAGDGRLALDFHEELYPQANAVVHGEDPYPPAGQPDHRYDERDLADCRGASRPFR